MSEPMNEQKPEHEPQPELEHGQKNVHDDEHEPELDQPDADEADAEEKRHVGWTPLGALI